MVCKGNACLRAILHVSRGQISDFVLYAKQIIINNLTRVGSKEFRASRARASGSVEEGGSRSVKFLSMRLRVWCRSCASAF